MKLTTKGRYAVSAMADIAANSPANDTGAPVPAPQIAERQGIPVNYLEQLFSKLRRAGLINSVRGVGGGYALSRPASEIRIADIIDAADETIKTTACEPGHREGCQGAIAGAHGGRCMTHDLWNELGRQIDLFLNSVTLEDVVERRVVGMAAVNPPRETSATMFAAEKSRTTKNSHTEGELA